MTEIDKPAPSSLSALPRRLAWQLAARAELLVVAGVTLLVLATATALSLPAAVVAWALISAYALAVPARRPEATGRLARSGSTSADLADRARQAVLDAMPEPSWLVDDGGKVRGSNAAALALFPRLRTGAANASAVRNPEIIDTIEAVRRDGVMRTAILHLRVPVERRLSVVVAPVPSSGDAVADPDLPPALLLLTSRDLTEQDRLSQMRADFVANASHELRTPLASLRGFVETLQGPARNDAGARERFLAIMAQQAERMTRLIDDLLSLSRVEMHQHVAPTAIVDMTEVATHVMQALEPQAARANIVLRCEVESRPLMVRGDRDELLQVVQNLVQNGIKYGRGDGRLEVAVRRVPGGSGRPDRVELAVTDDGPGIPAEHIPRLTERFYRVSVPQSRDKGGTGLGLAIVKHIVSRHGGEFRISSQLGQGSTFAVLIDHAGSSVTAK